MVAQKRKAVLQTGKFAAALAEAEVKAERVEKDQVMEEEKGQKRKAEKITQAPVEAPVKEALKEDNKVEEVVESAEDKAAREEKELVATRTKELKATPVDVVKELNESKGLEMGNKQGMIEAIVAWEAKARAQVRQHAANIRAVVVNKKAELEALSAPELKDLCATRGIVGVLAKPVRVELLLKQWQEADGVDKALATLAREAREAELVAMDKATLLKFCGRAGVSPFVKEVIVDRIIRCEVAAGRFVRPVIVDLDEVLEEDAHKSQAVDMVDALLANDAARKKEAELKKQQEEAEIQKRKELQAMTNEQLKKLLASKDQQAAGKKDDMVEALFAIHLQEEATAAEKKKLLSLPTEVLNKVLLSKGLELGKKDEMVASLLAYKAKVCEAAHVYAAKFQEVLMAKKSELESRTGADLKDLCTSKGLTAGGTQEDRVERLLEEAKKSGEIDTRLAVVNRGARQAELLAMDVELLQKLCTQAGADPLVKEIMVERLMSHEVEFGQTELEPKAKKARVSKN